MRINWQAPEIRDFCLEFGQRLATVRRAVKISQGKTARAAGIRNTYLCRVEKGKHLPSIPTIMKIAEAMEVPVCAICPFGVEMEEFDEVNPGAGDHVSG